MCRGDLRALGLVKLKGEGDKAIRHVQLGLEEEIQADSEGHWG